MYRYFEVIFVLLHYVLYPRSIAYVAIVFKLVTYTSVIIWFRPTMNKWINEWMNEWMIDWWCYWQLLVVFQSCCPCLFVVLMSLLCSWEGCEELWWVCLFACLSACLYARITRKPHGRTSNFYGHCLRPLFGPPLTTGVNLDKKNGGALTMASAEHEPIMVVWGGAPCGVQGQSPWSGSRGAKPLKLKAFWESNIQRKGQTGLMSVF